MPVRVYCLTYRRTNHLFLLGFTWNAVRPYCQWSKPVVYGASRNEMVNVHCAVESHPNDVTFRWLFNTSLEAVQLSSSSVSSFGSHSNVSHRIHNDQDYGTLLCWATNAIGEQREPCVFLIQPAGKHCHFFSAKDHNLSCLDYLFIFNDI